MVGLSLKACAGTPAGVSEVFKHYFSVWIAIKVDVFLQEGCYFRQPFELSQCLSAELLPEATHDMHTSWFLTKSLVDLSGERDAFHAPLMCSWITSCETLPALPFYPISPYHPTSPILFFLPFTLYVWPSIFAPSFPGATTREWSSWETLSCSWWPQSTSSSTSRTTMKDIWQ